MMFHILLILLFKFLMELKPSAIDKPQEHRIKVALDERPKSDKKSAALDNEEKPIEQAPPMPKGKQLDKLPQQAKAPSEQAVVKAEPASKPISEEIVAIKPAYKHAKKIQREDINITKTEPHKEPKKSTGLYAALSKKQTTKEETKTKTQSGTQIGTDFQEAYGEEFGKLSEGEKKYIVDNQEVMRRITQEQLNRLGPVNIPRNLNVNTMNIIEFYLHPNGDISDLKIVDASGYNILDDTSLQTIEYSYHRYPLPKQKTMIRYKVGYYLGGHR